MVEPSQPRVESEEEDVVSEEEHLPRVNVPKLGVETK
jgi:hypothetical protein